MVTEGKMLMEGGGRRTSRDQGLRNIDSDKARFCKQQRPAHSNISFSSVFQRRA